MGKEEFRAYVDHFNCTIQELKQKGCGIYPSSHRKFQLHHTGIKTSANISQIANKARFQLHHTGIKTIHVFTLIQYFL